MDKETLLTIYKAITKRKDEYIENLNDIINDTMLDEEIKNELSLETWWVIKGLNEALKVVKEFDKAN